MIEERQTTQILKDFNAKLPSSVTLVRNLWDLAKDTTSYYTYRTLLAALNRYSNFSVEITSKSIFSFKYLVLPIPLIIFDNRNLDNRSEKKKAKKILYQYNLL